MSQAPAQRPTRRARPTASSFRHPLLASDHRRPPSQAPLKGFKAQYSASTQLLASKHERQNAIFVFLSHSADCGAWASSSASTILTARLFSAQSPRGADWVQSHAVPTSQQKASERRRIQTRASRRPGRTEGAWLSSRGTRGWNPAHAHTTSHL